MAASTSSSGNLGNTKFLFIQTSRDDDALGSRMRSVGAQIARGFFNDFDDDGSRDVQPHETIQVLVAEGDTADRTGLAGVRYAVQVSAKYQARLDELELKRRLGEAGEGGGA